MFNSENTERKWRTNLTSLSKRGQIRPSVDLSSNFLYFKRQSHMLDTSTKQRYDLAQRPKRESQGTNTTSKDGIVYENKRLSNTSMFVGVVIVTVVGHLVSSPAQTFANIATLQNLGKDGFSYGTQRAFGAVGWGVLAFGTGISLQFTSRRFPCYDTGNPPRFRTDYTPIFLVFQLSMSLAFMLSLLMAFKSDLDKPEDDEQNHCAEDKQVVTAPTVVVFLTAIFCGINNGFIDSFLAWHLTDVGGTALLFSIMFAIETVGDTVGFLGSAMFLQCFGPSTGIGLGLLSYVIRLGCYGLAVNPWIVLSVEVLKIFTSGILWSSLVAYIGLQRNYSATLQSVLHSAYWGLGNGAGGIFGGLLVSRYGAASTFLGLSGLSSLQLVVFMLMQYTHRQSSEGQRGKYSVLNAYEY